MTATIDDLNRRFGIGGVVRFDAGQNGLTRAVVTTPAAEAHVYLHGAHVTHYQRATEPPVLFMTRASHFEDGKPIRGGVPVIFPWFGPRAGHPDAPAHGLIRQKLWQVESVTRTPGSTPGTAPGSSAGGIILTFLIRDDAQTLASWPFPFEVRHHVTIGPSLTMTLEVRNTGSQAFSFEEALHTYFKVSDVRQATVTGLDGVDYISKIEGGARKTQRGHNTFTGETDRVYVDTRTTCVLEDPGLKRRISVAKRGSGTTVVWTPWIAKAKALPDFGDEEWPEMVCIETVNAMDQEVTLAPGAAHEMTALIEVSKTA